MALRIASPIPIAIAVGTIFDIATASGIVWLALATALQAEDRQRWAANGAVFGLVLGVVVYLISLLTWPICRQ
jgi:membrane-associated PAP2 superfamily phosphatase